MEQMSCTFLKIVSLRKIRWVFFPLSEDFCIFPLDTSANEFWQQAGSAVKGQEPHACNLAIECAAVIEVIGTIKSMGFL